MPHAMEVGLGPGDFMLDGDPAPLPKRGRIEPPIFSAHVYCGQTAGRIKIALGMAVDLSPGDFVLDEDPATLPPPQKGAEPPSKFSAHFYCGQTAECIKMPLSMEVGLSPGDFLFDGDPDPPPLPSKKNKSGRSPQFSAHVYCDQTARWIKMPLGMEVGLSPDDIVLAVDPAHPAPKGIQMALGMEVGLGPGHIVLDGDPAPPPLKEHSPQFSANIRCGQTAGWTKMPVGTR